MKKFTWYRVRTIFQILYTIVTNGYAYGFMNGKIYHQGTIQHIWVKNGEKHKI